jgi:hypothetical protein
MAITSSPQPHCLLSTCERAAMQPGHQKRLSNVTANDQAAPRDVARAFERDHIGTVG